MFRARLRAKSRFLMVRAAIAKVVHQHHLDQLKVENIFAIFAGYQTAEDGGFDVSDEAMHDFKENGFVVVKSLLKKEELRNLVKTLEEDSCFKVPTKIKQIEMHYYLLI